MSYEVKLDVFEGPLDLLLHLIRRLEVDIYDIPMAELTQQYLDHIEAMRILELDELSEYLVLAATLIEIKSKTLLPTHDSEEVIDDWQEEDPRETLVERLLQYEKYKKAAKKLEEKAEERSEHYSKLPAPVEEREEAFDDTPLNVFDLIYAFQKMLDRKKLKEPMTATIERVEYSVEEKMTFVQDMLQSATSPVYFDDLFDSEHIEEIVVTFLAILELAKHQQITLLQEENFGPLLLEWREEQ